MEKLLYLFLSVSLSAGRNITTKKTAIGVQSQFEFFRSQALLFGTAGLLMAFWGVKDLGSVSVITMVYGVVYGILLIVSQWAFAFSLKTGSAAVCAVIYALGFIFPTLSGAVFWGEDFTVLHLLGMAGAVFVILFAAQKTASTIHPAKVLSLLSYWQCLHQAVLASCKKYSKIAKLPIKAADFC